MFEQFFRGVGTESPALINFNPYTRSSDEELLYYDRYRLISRSRYLYSNTPIGKSIIDVLVSHIVGTGLRLQIADRDIEAEFNKWASKHDFGCYDSFDQIQELVMKHVLLDGDILVHAMSDATNELDIQLIPSERISNPGCSSNTDTMRNGVELDANGYPINYHILTKHPSEPGYTYTKVPIYEGDEKTSWLVFKRDRSDSHRGIPIFTPCIEEFRMLYKYVESELVASVVSANQVTIVKTEAPQSDPFASTEQKEFSDGSIRNIVKVNPGGILHIGVNDSVEQINPNRPNQQFGAFIDTVTKHICTGCGLSYEFVTMSFNANYSASKAAMAQSWKTISSYRKALIKYFCNPVFNIWCKLHGYGEIDDIDWIGPNKGVLDDLKEIQAATARVELGISSRTEECEELRGKSWDIVLKNLQREKELMPNDFNKEQPSMDNGIIGDTGLSGTNGLDEEEDI